MLPPPPPNKQNGKIGGLFFAHFLVYPVSDMVLFFFFFLKRDAFGFFCSETITITLPISWIFYSKIKRRQFFLEEPVPTLGYVYFLWVFDALRCDDLPKASFS